MSSKDGQSRVMLSFTDILTCVFGAVILIFLIFAILTVFSPIGTDRIGRETGSTDRDLVSIQDALLEGYATSTLRIMTPSPEILAAIDFERLPLPSDVERLRIRVLASDHVYVGEHIDFKENIENMALHFRLDKPIEWRTVGSNEIVVSLAVGGMVSCLRIPISQAIVADQGDRPLLEVDLHHQGFLYSQIGGASCVDI